MKEVNVGYIYIYKCVVGSGSDVCKIGITKDFHKRLQQHVRTPYYGFMPYIEFTTGNPIATVFKGIMRQIIDKYSEELPEELLLMLRDKDDYIENCNSHYVRGNYIDCPNNMVLDLNYNKEKRLEILNKLKKII